MDTLRERLAQLRRALDEDDFPSDDEIDFSDIPEATDEWFARAKLVIPEHLQDEWDRYRFGEPDAPAVHVSASYGTTGKSTRSNHLGMRPMQERAYEKRGEQYLLIKSPPASGKSRALMFIALDKLHNQDVKQAIIAVPERMIGRSFSNANLTEHGFWADWDIPAKRNLCDAQLTDSGKVDSIGDFLNSNDRVLLCTHASFRFAVERFGIEAFDNRLIAIDEFHHVAANEDNKLGTLLTQIMERNKSHIVAMTGSYFRGDSEPVLSPEDEAKFETVTFTYYEQLNGYEHLKYLDIKFSFYSGRYIDDIMEALDPNKKTIIHIPSVNARESMKDKYKEVQNIVSKIGEWQGKDDITGFDKIKSHSDRRILLIADLVDDDPGKREVVAAALRDPERMGERDYVDIIIALGMAKEGFDWIWCEHALTVGYRASLMEIVQIIGRVTRDAPGKTRALFTNLISEPDASSEVVSEAVNDTLKAIAASLLMEQVLAPKFRFTEKNPNSKEEEGFRYGEEGYYKDKNNVGVCEQTGEIHVEISGLKEPKSELAKKVCEGGINDLVAELLQDKNVVERGVFDQDQPPQVITDVKLGKIIRNRYPDLDEEDAEAIRQRTAAALNLTQRARDYIPDPDVKEEGKNTALVDGIRKFALSVKELNIDLIDRIDTFDHYYEILSKSLGQKRFLQIAEIIASKKAKMSPEEARDLLDRAVAFKKERGRPPSPTSANPFEVMMADAVNYIRNLPPEQSDE